jgi:hypothetical protein
MSARKKKKLLEKRAATRRTTPQRAKFGDVTKPLSIREKERKTLVFEKSGSFSRSP